MSVMPEKFLLRIVAFENIERCRGYCFFKFGAKEVLVVNKKCNICAFQLLFFSVHDSMVYSVLICFRAITFTVLYLQIYSLSILFSFLGRLGKIKAVD